MKFRKSIVRSASLITVLIMLATCQKEKNWSTTIELINDVTAGSARIEAEHLLPRNDNYVYVGVCLSESEDPTVNSYFYDDRQELDSDLNTFYFDGLSPNTLYYARSFIKTKDGGVIYSENSTFTTDLPAEAPCEPTAGQIQFNGSTYVMYDLYESTGETYKLETSCSLGELTFTFASKPTPNVYTTVASVSDLTSTTVRFDGILGGIFSCYYGASSNSNIYVTVSDTEEISIEFCDIKMTAASCETDYMLIGEVHQ